MLGMMLFISAYWSTKRLPWPVTVRKDPVQKFPGYIEYYLNLQTREKKMK